MSQVDQPITFNVVAVYPDHESVERAMSRLHADGFEMRDLSIVGRDFRVNEEESAEPMTMSDYATTGAEFGAVVGGLFGLCVGMAFLILPGLGPVVVAGPIAAALAGGAEGSLAGASLGALVGALVGWGVPHDRALEYRDHVKSGKYLVLARGDATKIEHARAVLHHEALEHEKHEAFAHP
ncbi:general stress protein [Paludisphaera borealis]|uniref:General stress protein 17M-like domain-containing protein n=1 Tax=Paludisphaera borealis TaxID=1387353 RepID=A0A1U7CUC1_9BACT|nr:hypothetical protein BSF38_04098 [Paludisphaera borealis]